ncbi:hypothetical protein Hanom_Chr09g00830441 [Helianthus anomalus]
MDLVEVHPLLCSQAPEACSSTYQPGSATKHFVVPHPHVYFFRPAAAVEDVPGRASPLPVARLGRQSLYPVTFIHVRSVIHTLFIVQYFNAINGKCTFRFISCTAIRRMLSTTSTFTSFLFFPMSHPRG